MPKSPTLGRARWLVVVALLLGWAPLRAEWLACEQRTAAYVVLGLEMFLEWNLAPPEGDPFGEEKPTDGPPFPEPVRLTEKIPASRFFEEGDELWLVTEILSRVEVLEAGTRSWAIYTNTRQRLVLHGSRGDHGRMDHFWRLVLDHTPLLLETRSRLLKVPSRELDGVEWTADMVRERGAEELLALTATTRPGLKGSVRLTGVAAEGSLEVEPNVGPDDDVIDLPLSYTARLREELGSREIDIKTALAVRDGVPFYLEAGSENDEAHTLLVELTSQVQFMDGTLRSRWREFEDPRHELSEAEAAALAWSGRDDLGNGFSRGTWQVPPTLLTDADSGGGGEEADPFADDGEGGGDAKLRRYPLVESPDPVSGLKSGGAVYDISEVMRESGIENRKGGWVYYVAASSVVIAKLDPSNLDLIEDLLGCRTLGPSNPTVIRVSVSLIEWEGPDLEQGRIPTRARRVGKAALVARPGQKATMLLGQKNEETSELAHGLSLEVEPNVGASDSIFDLHFALYVRGVAEVKSLQVLKLRSGRATLLPLGRLDGKSVAVVVEATAVELDGAARREP